MDVSKEGGFKGEEWSPSFDVSPERLNRMSPSALAEEMERALDAMTEDTYDPAVIDAYLTAMDRQAPMPEPPGPEEAYGALRATLGRELMGQEQAPPPKSPSGRRRSAFRMGLAAAAAAVCLLGLMVIAQAAGADVFGRLARWTEETFSFGSVRSRDPQEPADSNPQRENSAEFAAALPPEYQELGAELEARGIDRFLFPTYLPDGFMLEDSRLNVLPESNTINFSAWYVNGSDEIAFGVLLSDTVHSTFEKDSGDVEIFTIDGFDHYIFSNMGENVAVWCIDNLEYSLAAPLPVSELKAILNSMYQE